ncbi:putative histidine kinase [uncultured Gammaproteobacteria bacterium]
MALAKSLRLPFRQLIKTYTVLISCGAVTCLTWAMVIVDRLNDRDQFIASARQTTANYAQVLEGQIRQTVLTIDQILVAVRFERDSLRWRDLYKKMALTSGLDKAIYNLSFFARDGGLTSTTISNANQNANISDRPWFIKSKATQNDTLYISSPVISRATNLLSSIFARGIWNDQGDFVGMVGISLNPEHFGSFYRRIPMGQRGIITLMGMDSTIFARATAAGVSYGQPASSPGMKRTLALAQDKKDHDTIYITTTEAIDGVAKVLSYRSLGEYGLVIAVGLAEDEVLAEFYEETKLVALTAFAFSVILIVLAVIGQRRARVINQQAQSLEDDAQRLKKQAVALELARKKAEEADRLKGDFIANMSHEFRTPLNAIIGFSSLMSDLNLKDQDRQSGLYLDGIQSAGSHLLNMVNDILDMAQLENGNLIFNRTHVDLVELIKGCAEITLPLRKEKSMPLKIEGDTNCLSYCDPDRVRQAVLNILSNSTKFSHNGTAVTIKIGRSNAKHVSILIADNGIGMTSEELTVAMTPFAQVSSGFTKTNGGTGLGLPLVRRLIECQNGSFSIHSVKGKGTTVIMTLPVDGGPVDGEEDVDIKESHCPGMPQLGCRPSLPGERIPQTPFFILKLDKTIAGVGL